jgi:hypothetical protein
MPNKTKIYDREKVIAGLAIFLIIVMFPFWYNLGKAAPAPELKLSEKAKAAKACVRPTDFMRAQHMQVLDTWRTAVVREGKRAYINSSGKQFDMSLSNTCLDCHAEKTEFCDRCHTYAAVTPYCWDCHIDNPKETK